ncbi:MAG: tryptophan synthase subunit alpha, partial [Acidobacteria bacterium]
MSRISDRLARLRARGRKAFVGFVTAGDPSLDRTVEIAQA